MVIFLNYRAAIAHFRFLSKKLLAKAVISDKLTILKILTYRGFYEK